MNPPYISIHPYFQLHPGKLEEAKALLPQFTAKTSTEPGCRHYDFTISGDVVFCREGYGDAGAVLAHLQNVDAELQAMLGISDLARMEIHGPAAELAKLKEPLAALKPTWFTYETGIDR